MKRILKTISFRVSVIWIYIKAFVVVMYRFFKARTGMVIYRINAFTTGARFITASEFLTMFPAKKSCKRCSYGQGFYISQRADKTKEIIFCDCVLKQYEASGRKFIVKGIE